ncbi:MAG: hypothetical protein M3229_02450 [Actinomycetota bacterium]|nr:hypothetical protein [Thermoleophilia bacterium]MDQ3992498.1 hypothetical protein [Actinomycetota bacterium]
MPEPPSLDVEPERADESRRRVTLIAVGALLLLVVVIAAIVIAGNSDDDGDDAAPRVSNITDLLTADRNGTRVTVSGQVQAIREQGRIFALAESNVGEPDVTSEGAVLVIAENAGNLSEGDTVQVTGRVYDLESNEVTEAAGRELGGADGYPEFRAQPVVIASDVGSG